MLDRTITGLLACALIAPVSGGYAQRIPDSLLRLKVGATLRVETASRGRIDGRLIRTAGDTLFLSAQQPEMVVAMPDLRGLWERGRATKTGALAGGLIGAAGMGTVGGVFCGGIDGTCNNRGGNIVLGAVIGAAGGALIGGVIGAAIPKWHRRYP